MAAGALQGCRPGPRVSPGSLDFSVGETTLSVLVNVGAADRSWSAESDALWLTLELSSGAGPCSVTVTVDRDRMTTGVKQGEVTVTAGDKHATISVSATCLGEWRQAQRVTAGPEKVRRLGPLPVGAALRLGILEGPKPVRVGVWVGSQAVETFETGPETRWKDRRIELAGRGPVGADCHVSFSSEAPFWLGPCELVGEDHPSANAYAVYAWYVPPPDTVSQDQLEPAMREALEALGYID